MNKDFDLMIERRVLLDALSFIKKNYKLSPYAVTNPVLKNIIIENGHGKMAAIRHCGIEMQFHTSVETDKCNGRISLPIELLHNIIAAGTDNSVVIRYNEGDTHASIYCGEDYCAKIIPLDQSTLPEQPEITGPGLFFPAGAMKWLFDLTEPFICMEETRYYLNGICFEIRSDQVRAIATDGHRLGTRFIKIPHQPKIEDISFIVPRHAVKAVEKLLPDKEVEIVFNDTHVRIAAGNWTITSRLVDGTFPEWRLVVPDDETMNVCFDIPVQKIRQITHACSGFRKEEVMLQTDAGSLILSQASYENDSIRVKCAGNYPDIGKCCVNLKYLAAIGKALGGRTLQWAMNKNDPSKPFLITGDDSADNGYVLLMPMRIQPC